MPLDMVEALDKTEVHVRSTVNLFSSRISVSCTKNHLNSRFVLGDKLA